MGRGVGSDPPLAMLAILIGPVFAAAVRGRLSGPPVGMNRVLPEAAAEVDQLVVSFTGMKISESASLVWSTIVRDPFAVRLSYGVPRRRIGLSVGTPLHFRWRPQEWDRGG